MFSLTRSRAERSGSPPALGRNPESSTTSFVRAIRRNARTLLSAEQAEHWEALLDAEAVWRQAQFTIPSLPDEAMAQVWRPVDEAYRAFFLSQARHIDELSRAGYDFSDVKMRSKLAAQSGRELADLDKKMESKLTSGKKQREMVESSAAH